MRYGFDNTISPERLLTMSACPEEIRTLASGSTSHVQHLTILATASACEVDIVRIAGTTHDLLWSYL
jgi:hypothetical protein